VREETRRIRELNQWLGQLRLSQLRKEIPIGEAIDRVRARMQNATAEDQHTLAVSLKTLLTEAARDDEALHLIDSVIERRSDNVRFPISKAILYFDRLGDPESALQAIDFALERAFRTGFFRREALGEKARILLRLGRGEELGQVLEQIMSLKMSREIPDIPRQRDFVDAAPRGLIPQDIVARYDEFCPRPDDPSALPSEPPEWSPVDEEIWFDADPNGDIVESADGDYDTETDRWWELHQWVRQLRKEIPIDDIIDRVRSRLQNADAGDREALEFELGALLTEAQRDDEVLQMIDSDIRRTPDDARPLISKATHYYYRRDDLPEALKWIELALERAFRTRYFRREALSTKARILLDLGRGEELGQVLEQIMALDMYRDVPDIGKERDFVDRAPAELIPEDIVARYNRFFPKGDRELELHRWADHVRQEHPIEEAIDCVWSRIQTARADDLPTLTHILGIFLADAGRYDEALPLFDSVIEQQPDNVRSAIAKATVYLDFRDDPEKALEVIDFALERAFRTRFYRRQAFGLKARILLKSRRGDELGQLLEQIMSLEMFSDVRDTGRERDFVDRAPPGLIPEDIVTRYNEFCPKLTEPAEVQFTGSDRIGR
jgi:tetratricopeptide (TPR) repeat protein